MADILIIDDDLAFIKATKRLLFNHEVIFATDGLSGIELLEHNKLDLVLLGMQMPKMNGLSVFEIITKAFADYPPTIMLSECGCAKLEEKFLKIGGRDFLATPFDDDELLVKVNKVLEEEQQNGTVRKATETESFRIIEAVDQVIRVFAKRVKIQKEIEQDREITTDRWRFSIVLTNLVENAVNFTKDIVAVEAREISGDVVIAVADNGMGIDEGKLRDIFELRGGTGLFMAYKIVTMLGGRIWLESEPDKGSIFYFSIPQKHDLH